MADNNENKKDGGFNFPPVGGGKNIKAPKFNGYWMYIILAVIIIGFQFFNMNPDPVRTTWQEVKTKMLEKGDIEKITVITNKGQAQVYMKPDKIENYSQLKSQGFKNSSPGPQFYFSPGPLETFSKEFSELQEKTPAAADIKIDYDQEYDGWGNLFSIFFPIALLVFIWIFFFRRMSKGGGGPGGVFNVGKSQAKLFDKDTHIKITFKDVAGLAEAKQEVEEIVSFLKSPDKYTKLGGKIPKGALLVGPPGTGKTLMAKAMAGEANVPFFSMSGSDFVEMFVGVGASRVRDLFKQAKEKAPCIIFIDEIDAIGRARGKNPNMGSNDERENTLNQLLTEMDGFETNSGVIILAATNRADILDSALLRAGRFDRQIYVDLPELKDREEIFKVHLKPLKLAGDVDIPFLAKQTPGFSGADIANVANEAALIAARKDKNEVEKQDFLDAIDRIVGGLENRIARTVFAIPAVKGVEFGAGFAAAALRGSENNDGYTASGGEVRTLSNHSGGICGGLTTGMPVVFRAAFKPTPSIARPQRTVALPGPEETTLTVGGRHDPCVVPRAVPVVEAVAALTMYDLLLCAAL